MKWLKLLLAIAVLSAHVFKEILEFLALGIIVGYGGLMFYLWWVGKGAIP